MEKSESEKMEKSDSDTGLELDASLQVQVAEDMVEDEPQREKQEDPDNQIQNTEIAGVKEKTSNETLVGSPDEAKNESGQTLQPKVQQCEESMHNVPEMGPGSTGMENETLAGECQATAQMADDAETEVMAELNEQQQNMLEADKDSDDELGEKADKELPVQQVQQVMELVLEEAVVCVERPERMEEAEDIEEPQKYAFREKSQ